MPLIDTQAQATSERAETGSNIVSDIFNRGLDILQTYLGRQTRPTYVAVPTSTTDSSMNTFQISAGLVILVGIAFLALFLFLRK